MRPIREYWFLMSHAETKQSVELYASGDTPCHARNSAWTLFEQMIKEQALPPNEWRLMQQQPADWHRNTSV